MYQKEKIKREGKRGWRKGRRVTYRLTVQRQAD